MLLFQEELGSLEGSCARVRMLPVSSSRRLVRHGDRIDAVRIVERLPREPTSLLLLLLLTVSLTRVAATEGAASSLSVHLSSEAAA